MKSFEELKEAIKGNSFNESHLSRTQVVDLETVLGLIEDFEQCTIPIVMCCDFAYWVNLHTHFYKPVHAKLWYDRSEYYGDKGFTTEEMFRLFLEQYCT